MTTGLLYDPRYLDHQTSDMHPESPARLSTTISYLEKLPYFKDLKPVKPREINLDWILEVHSPDYVARVEESCLEGYPLLDSPDVGISQDSFEVSRLAVGGVLELADEVMSGKINNGFALLRPPGHHAERDHAMGFCIFNNIAILAKYLQIQHNIEKVAILDWDVHHGNGTQHTFEEDSSVLYISLHQYPFYPGTGSENETGVGHGRGFTLNCPMSAGSTDKDYKEAFAKKIMPKLKEFKPDFMLVSAGFDAHKEDPIANICLTTECFSWMTKQVVEAADEFSNKRMLSVLEGGYNHEILAECIAKHLQEMLSSSEQKS